MDAARRWTMVAGRFFAAHFTQQAAAMATGLLFIHMLPVEDFATYTLATTVLMTFSFLTDLGSSFALLHFFRQSRLGQQPYAHMAKAILSLRRWLFLLGAPGAVGFLVWWGLREELPTSTVVAFCVVVVATVWVQVLGTTRVYDLRLQGRYNESYAAEIAAAGARLLMAVMIVVVGLRSAPAALTTGLIGAVVLAWRSKAGLSTVAAAPRVPGLRRKVLRYLAPTLPSAVYYAAQGQFVVWCAALFGNLTVVANIGALGRLALLVGTFGGLTQVVFLPRLVQIVDERLFLRRVVQFGVILSTAAGFIWVASWVAPSTVLWVLGSSYQGLEVELQLIVMASGMSLVGAYLGAVASARSWNRWQPAALLAMMIVQALLILWLPLGTTVGVAWFAVWSAAIGLVAQTFIVGIGLVRPSWVAW